jgi:hypothetical protein
VRSRRLRTTAAVVVCATALAGCGTVHPGAAAQVGDVTVSDSELERGTTGFCELIDVINQAQQGANPPVPVRSALLSALNTLVMGAALDQLADRNGVEVTGAEINQWISGLPLDLSQVPPQNDAAVRQTMERVGRNSLLVEKLGRAVYRQQNPGSSEAPPDQVQQLGQQLADSFMERSDVDIDPRYGQVLDTQRLPGSGSLSIAVSEEGRAGQTVPQATNTLSKNQECA